MKAAKKFLILNAMFVLLFLSLYKAGLIPNGNYWIIRIAVYCCLILIIQVNLANWKYIFLMSAVFIYTASNFLLLEFFLEFIKQYSFNLAMILFMGNFVLILLILYFILKKEGKMPLRIVKLFYNKFSWIKAAKIMVLFCITIILVEGAIYFSGIKSLLANISNYYFPIPRAGAADISLLFIILSIIYRVILAPVFEELFFRGMLFNLLESKLGTVITAIFISLVFAVIYEPETIINMFALGLVLSYIYKREENLIYPIIAHIIYNIFTVLI